MPPVRSWSAGVAIAVLGLVLGACASSDILQDQPQVPRQGIQATGRVDGARIAISTGSPEVVLGDCDPGDGPDLDLCVVARTIGGVRLAVVVENPQLLVAGEQVEVRTSDCEAETCDAVDGHLVVDVRIGDDSRRARGGALDIRHADDRYAASFSLRLPGGDDLDGHFDVAPD